MARPDRSRRSFSPRPEGYTRRDAPGKRPPSGGSRTLLWVLTILVIGGVALLALLLAPYYSAKGVAALLPFPKKLLAIEVVLSEKPLTLAPDSRTTINPRDTIAVSRVRTDGLLSWGVKVVSPEVKGREFDQRPVAIRELFPGETFEEPKNFDLEARFGETRLGAVTFTARLDAKDWHRLATAARNPEDKIRYFKKVLEEDPANTLVKTQVAHIFSDLKKYDEAARLYREVLQAGKSRAVLERLLQAQQAQKRVDDALATYLEILKLTPDADTFKQFVAYLQKNKSSAEAAKYLRAHDAQIPKSFQSSAAIARAEIASQAKDWSEAADAFDDAMKSGVKDPTLLYNMAVSLEQAGQTEKAVLAYQRYLQRSPNDSKVWYKVAELQEKKGDVAGARATWEQIHLRNPKAEDPLLKLAALAQKAGDKKGLLTVYERLAALKPPDKVLRFNMGVLYLETQRWDKAEEMFKALAAADPKDVESRKYLLEINRRQKDKDGELETLRQLSNLEPGNADHLDGIYAIYRDKKDWDDMVAFFRKAAAAHPQNVKLYQYILFGALKKDDTKTALKTLDDLQRLEPKKKEWWRQSAALYEKEGNLDAALAKYKHILDLDPKDKEAEEDYMRLRLKLLGKKGAAPAQ